MTVSLAVIDESPLLVAGLRAVLEPYAGRVRFVEVEARSPLPEGADVVLHDPLTNTGARPFRSQHLGGTHGPRFAVFSWGSDANRVGAALAAGADGQLSKTLSPEELVDAVERLHGGERVGLSDVHPAPRGVQRQPGAEHGLSPRESEVLVWICQGVSNAEIAGRVFVSVNTVKTYVRSAYRKIGVTTRPQAVIWGMANGFGASAADNQLAS